MIFEKVLNLFFPIKCGVCGKIGLPICKECEESLKPYEINLVQKDKFFIYKYQDIIRNLLLNYKFNDASYLANSFAYLIKNNKKIYSILKSYDIIIPVPLHKKRMNERGYNQTELIAKKLGIPVETNCLIKNKKHKATKHKKS